jgi:hypothetical protein
MTAIPTDAHIHQILDVHSPEACDPLFFRTTGTKYFHSCLGLGFVAPDHQQVLPLSPEFTAPQDSREKQDCERNAGKRWLARHGPMIANLRPVFHDDDLFPASPTPLASNQLAVISYSSANQRHSGPSPSISPAPSGRTPQDCCHPWQTHDNDLPLALRRADAPHH